MANEPKPRTCGSPEHRIHRRLFLEGAAKGALSVFSFSGLFSLPAFAEQAAREHGLPYRPLGYRQLHAAQQRFLRAMGRRPESLQSSDQTQQARPQGQPGSKQRAPNCG